MSPLYYPSPVDPEAERPRLPLLSARDTARELRRWRLQLLGEQLKPKSLLYAFNPATLIAYGLNAPLVPTQIPHQKHSRVWRSAFRATFVALYDWMQDNRLAESKLTEEDVQEGVVYHNAYHSRRNGFLKIWRHHAFRRLGYPNLEGHITTANIVLLASEAKFRRLFQSRELKLDRNTDTCLRFLLNNWPNDGSGRVLLSGTLETAETFTDQLARMLDKHHDDCQRPITAPELEVVLKKLHSVNMADAYTTRHEGKDTTISSILGSAPYVMTYDKSGSLTNIEVLPLPADEQEELLQYPDMAQLHVYRMHNPASTGCPAIHAKIKTTPTSRPENNLVDCTLTLYANAARTGILTPEEHAEFKPEIREENGNYRKPLPARPAAPTKAGECPFHKPPRAS